MVDAMTRDEAINVCEHPETWGNETLLQAQAVLIGHTKALSEQSTFLLSRIFMAYWELSLRAKATEGT